MWTTDKGTAGMDGYGVRCRDLSAPAGRSMRWKGKSAKRCHNRACGDMILPDGHSRAQTKVNVMFNTGFWQAGPGVGRCVGIHVCSFGYSLGWVSELNIYSRREYSVHVLSYVPVNYVVAVTWMGRFNVGAARMYVCCSPTCWQPKARLSSRCNSISLKQWSDCERGCAQKKSRWYCARWPCFEVPSLSLEVVLCLVVLQGKALASSSTGCP